MSLACLLGLHRPALPALWNAGYYFSRCRRCQRDLIRPPWGRWRIPSGFRVVWKTPAEAALGVLLRDLDETKGPEAGPLKTHVPLQEVLRRLHHSDFMHDERRRGSWDGDIAIAVTDALRRVDRSDFMNSRRGDRRPEKAPAARPASPAFGPANRVRS